MEVDHHASSGAPSGSHSGTDGGDQQQRGTVDLMNMDMAAFDAMQAGLLQHQVGTDTVTQVLTYEARVNPHAVAIRLGNKSDVPLWPDGPDVSHFTTGSVTQRRWFAQRSSFARRPRRPPQV